jgi:ABC-2 type transport system ATP-binding protein
VIHPSGVVTLATRRAPAGAHLLGGLDRRLEIVQSMIHRPRLLFLDEPAIGLDPAARVGTPGQPKASIGRRASLDDIFILYSGDAGEAGERGLREVARTRRSARRFG